MKSVVENLNEKPTVETEQDVENHYTLTCRIVECKRRDNECRRSVLTIVLDGRSQELTMNINTSNRLHNLFAQAVSHYVNTSKVRM